MKWGEEKKKVNITFDSSSFFFCLSETKNVANNKAEIFWLLTLAMERSALQKWFHGLQKP